MLADQVLWSELSPAAKKNARWNFYPAIVDDGNQLLDGFSSSRCGGPAGVFGPMNGRCPTLWRPSNGLTDNRLIPASIDSFFDCAFELLVVHEVKDIRIPTLLKSSVMSECCYHSCPEGNLKLWIVYSKVAHRLAF